MLQDRARRLADHAYPSQGKSTRLDFVLYVGERREGDPAAGQPTLIVKPLRGHDVAAHTNTHTPEAFGKFMEEVARMLRDDRTLPASP